MTDSERIIKVLEYSGLKATKFADYIGINTVQTIYDIKKGKHGISKEVADKIQAKYLNINIEWLLTGKGEMLRDSSKLESVTSSGYDSEHQIKYWRDIEATGGGLESFDDIKSDYVPLVLPDFRDCTDAVNIVGQSMEPTYKSGSIILIKEWTEKFIEFGNAYLIITNNGNRMVKIIDPGPDPAHIICRSINPAFAPFEVERADILRLYVVKGVISKSVM